MARKANAGEMKTKIMVESFASKEDADGYPQKTWKNIRPQGGTFWCKWVNAHGRDVFEAQQLGLNELATVTLRYSSLSALITPTCRLYKGRDPVPYDIISINNVEDANRWLEIKVHRKVASK